MQPDDSLVAMAEASVLIFVVIHQQLLFFSVSSIPNGPKSLVDRMKGVT